MAETLANYLAHAAGNIELDRVNFFSSSNTAYDSVLAAYKMWLEYHRAGSSGAWPRAVFFIIVLN